MLSGARIGLLVSWLCLALTIYLLRYKIALTSDSLFYDDLATDLFVHGGAWRDWKFSAAPGFVFDMLLYFIGFPLFPDAVSRMHFVSAAQACGLAVCACLAARAIAPGLRAQAHALIVTLVALVTLVSAKSGMWLYFHTTNNHFSTLLLALLMLVLLLRFIERPGKLLAMLALLAGSWATASSNLFFLTFIVPALLVGAGAWLLLPAGSARTRVALAMALLLGSQALGKLIEYALVFHPALEARAPWTMDAVGTSMRVFVSATASAFTPDRAATFVFSVGVALCLLFLLVRLVRWIKLEGAALRLALPLVLPDWRCTVAAALLCVSLPVTLLGMIASGALVDAAGYRYLIFPITLAILLTVILLDKPDQPAPWLVLTVVVAVVALQHARKATRPADPALAVAQCIVALERQGMKPDAGIADYWNARAVSTYLPRHNPILATIHTLRPLFWVSTIGPMAHPERYAPRRYNFAIIRDLRHPGQFHYTAETVGRHLPRPSTVHACADGQHHIWYYAGTELDGIVRREIAGFLPSLKLIPTP